MDSEAAASWLSQPDNRADFLGRFTPDTALKPHTYSLVVQFVPLQFRPDNEARLRDIEETNVLPRNAILHARWIKLVYRRAPDQTCGHVLVVMTRPEDANKTGSSSARPYTPACLHTCTHSLHVQSCALPTRSTCCHVSDTTPATSTQCPDQPFQL